MILHILKCILFPEDYDTSMLGKVWDPSDPRNEDGVIWHITHLREHNFQDSIYREDRKRAREAGIFGLANYYIEPTEQEVKQGYEVALSIIEEDSWDGEIHELDFKSQTVGDPHPGIADKVFVYKTWDSPDVITVRVRFNFEYGTYDKVECIFPE